MKSSIFILIDAAALVVVAVLLAACGSAPVQAWEKGALAKPEMGLDGDKLEAKFADHIYSSREAASGGAGVGGGGCGCN